MYYLCYFYLIDGAICRFKRSINETTVMDPIEEAPSRNRIFLAGAIFFPLFRLLPRVSPHFLLEGGKLHTGDALHIAGGIDRVDLVVPGNVVEAVVNR